MAIVVSLCVSYALYCLFTQPAGPITTPDSAHYLAFSPIVPLGYPAFLAIVGARGAMMLQPPIYAAALAMLGREIIRNTGRVGLAAATLIACMVVPQITTFHASILSESLFLSATIVVLALAVRFVYQPSWHLMVPLATVVGVSTTVRRTGVALWPVLLVMVLLRGGRLKGSQPVLITVAAIAPFLLIVAIEQAVAPIVHAGNTSSLMGRHLFAKAALLDAPVEAPVGTRPSDALGASLDEHLEVRYAPIRQLLARAPRNVRAVLAIYYETCLQGACADASHDLMPGQPESRQTAALGAAGWARIRRAPLAYAQLATLHLGSLWTVDWLRHPDTVASLGAFVEANRPLPFEREALRLEPGVPMALQPSPPVRYLQYAVSMLAVLTAALACLGLVAAVWKPELPPLLAAACLAALVAHGSLIFTALLAAGFSRFTLGVWPAIMTAALCGAWWLGSLTPSYWAVMLGRPLRKMNF